VLPNPKLMKCRTVECSQLWPTNSTEGHTIFPKQVRIDVDQGCVYGVTALYDKSIATDDVKAAIDKSYSNWALQNSSDSAVKLWRVTRDRFTIQLTVAGQFDEQMNFAQSGTNVLAFLAFEGKAACGAP
jgi:hypothetical protein